MNFLIKIYRYQTSPQAKLQYFSVQNFRAPHLSHFIRKTTEIAIPGQYCPYTISILSELNEQPASV